MELYAVLSDIHGNKDALEAVIADARKIAKEEGLSLHFVCLGDVVDLGPEPNECLAWVLKHAEYVVLGNHDQVAVAANDLDVGSINEKYWPISLWTRQVLAAEHRESVQEWHMERSLAGFVLFHGSLEWGINGRIDSADAADSNIKHLTNGTSYGLFGHTHLPGYFQEGITTADMYVACEAKEWSDKDSGWKVAPVDQWIDLPALYERTLLNPGSVGQPRYADVMMGSDIPPDYRASYLLLQLNGNKQGAFKFRRVDYRVSRTIRKLRAIRWPATPPNNGGGEITYRGSPNKGSTELEKRLSALKGDPEALADVVHNVLIPGLRGNWVDDG